jgi:hypothetical protein
MGKQHQTWMVEQQLTLILAALCDEHSGAGLARRSGVSEQHISRWKAPCLGGGRQTLGGAKAPRTDQRLQSEHEPLQKLLGEKALEIDIRTKRSRL